MKYRLLDYLVCPDCKEPFELEVDSEDAGEVRTGRLLCKKNNCVFTIENYVPRFVDADLYADTFSKQRLYVRRHFKHYKKDTSGDEIFLPTTQLSPEELKQSVTLFCKRSIGWLLIRAWVHQTNWNIRSKYLTQPSASLQTS